MAQDFDRDRLDNDRLADRPRGAGRLASLDELDDFKVADGDPDIRGWEVKTADGRRIGKVKDLIVDTAAMRVRYMDVHLDRDSLGIEGDRDRHVLLPIGRARLDDDDDEVIVPGLGADAFGTIPPHGGELTREYETGLHRHYGQPTIIADRREDDEFYGTDYFDDRQFWGRRRAGRESSPYITRG